MFAGPVFADTPTRNIRFGLNVPMKWKVVVWKAPGGPRSIALLADQKEVLDR